MSKEFDDNKDLDDDASLPGYSVLALDALSLVEGLIPPRRYQIQHDGFMKGVRIWVVDPATNPYPGTFGAPELDYDAREGIETDEKGEPSEKAQGETDPLATQSPEATSSKKGKGKEKEKKKRYKFKTINPAKVPGHYYIKRLKTGVYTLFEGPGPDDEFAGARRLIDISGEGFFSKKSSYTEASGQSRHARMYGTPPWYSCDRTLEDFEGNPWLFHTKAPTWTDDIEVTRQSDGVRVAFFDLAAWSVTGIGILDIKVPLKPDIFSLILSAWYVKYNVDAQRRRAARSNAAS